MCSPIAGSGISCLQHIVHTYQTGRRQSLATDSVLNQSSDGLRPLGTIVRSPTAGGFTERTPTENSMQAAARWAAVDFEARSCRRNEGQARRRPVSPRGHSGGS